MSFQNQGFQRFRETLKHEDHIHNQIEACRKVFNEGGSQLEMRAVKSLMLLITPHMEDEQFLAEVQKLNEKWEGEIEQRQKEYKKKITASAEGCPDLIEKPSKIPGEEHWEEMFMICCSLFERRNLMLKVETEDSI